MSQFSLRSYQSDLATKGCEILRQLWIVYLVMEVRTGKTHTAFECARLFGAQKVLFLTKKKVLTTKKQMGSIEQDYIDGGYPFEIVIINNESLHTVKDNDFDLIISDEHHRNSGTTKPNKITEDIRKRFKHLPMIFLSGTPSPECLTQLFHQFWVSARSPFTHNTFFHWFSSMGFVKVEFDNGYGPVGDYSNTPEAIFKYYGIEKRSIAKINPDGSPREDYDSKIEALVQKQNQDIDRMKKANENLEKILDQYFVRYTQQQAGFTSSVEEHILEVEMSPVTYSLTKKLRKDRVIQGKEEVILADTAAKLLSKLTQMFSGTVKFESGNAKTLDNTKAVFIKERFAGQKIGIFFKFKEEWKMLKEVFGDTITDKLDEFNTTDKNFGVQIVSGREAISLKNAKHLVYFTPDYSALSYWQSRDRMTTMDRLTNDVYWVFARGGVEKEIYKTVLGKKDFTVRHFERWVERQKD